jgi:hypothetical protein
MYNLQMLSAPAPVVEVVVLPGSLYLVKLTVPTLKKKKKKKRNKKHKQSRKMW